MTDATSLLPGLRPASYKGVTFWIEDAQQPVGRRVLATYFPGTDIKVHDDFGIFDGPFRISGLVVGDDYVAQAEALRSAFQSPGPGTFVHPWLGPKTCVVIRPAEISFATDELRVARIEVEFDPVGAMGSGFGASLGRVLGLLGQIGGAGRLLAALGLLPPVVSTLAWSSGLAAASSVIGIISSVMASTSQRAVLAAPEQRAVEELAVVTAQPTAAATATAIADTMARYVEAVGLAWRSAPAPAIAPAAEAAAQAQTGTAPAPGPRAAAEVHLSAMAALAAEPRLFQTDAAVLVAAELLELGELASSVLDIPFTSRQDAFGWLARTDAACGALAQRLVATARTRPALASPALALVASLRAALAADINEVAGRLPGVIVIEVGTPVPAIMIAQHLVGDEPARIEPMLRDIVTRNRIRHPGRVSGRIEVLL